MALARERVEFHGETIELPLPDGPGKALKLTIAPVQERIPIYLAAIGPKNTALAGEIADGWIPTLFSPEHVPELRDVARGGRRAGRAARSTASTSRRRSTSSSPTTSTRARDAMRPFIALYVGGMGSREKNFYNQLVQRYGFEDAAREVQDLYLEGKKRRGDGRAPRRADRPRVARAGRRTRARPARASTATPASARSAITPMAWTQGGPPRAAAAGRRAGRLTTRPLTAAAGRLRRPRARVPDHRAGPRAGARAATTSRCRRGSAGSETSRREGMRSRRRRSTTSSRRASGR